jgi:hypothetical protein
VALHELLKICEASEGVFDMKSKEVFASGSSACIGKIVGASGGICRKAKAA